MIISTRATENTVETKGSWRRSFDQLSAAQKGAGLHAPAYSRFINRRLGRIFAAGAHRAGLTPNAVTLISAAFTYSGIILLVFFPPTWQLGAVVGSLLILGYALDSADGQLARLTGGGSPAGEWLDHIADAVKISALPVFLAIGLFRFDAVPVHWLLVPLASAVVGPVYFFAMILTEQLRRSLGTAPTGGPAKQCRVPWTRSVLVLPMDYGVLCLIFLGLGALPLFMGLYLLTVLAMVGFTALALAKWFRELASAPRAAARASH